MRKVFVLAGVGALLGLCAIGGAAQAATLPNSSAVDQYIEAFPTAHGPAASPAPLGASPGAAPNASAKDRAAAVARATAPSRAGSGGASDSGMGLLLPLIMAASLLGAVALFLARRRHNAAQA